MKYYITSEQMETIEHLIDAFEANAEEIERICSSDSPVIKYGFLLGNIHTFIKQNSSALTELLFNKICNQKVKDSK